MKEREPRRKVFVAARMRCGAAWDDVRVLDVSSGGFLLQAKDVPRRGTYIELCRGRKSFVARVVWTGSECFGVRTRERVAVDAFVNPEHSEPSARESASGGEPAAMRRLEDNAHRFERSRQRARALEYGSLIGVGAFAALLIAMVAGKVLAMPLGMVSAALG